MVVTDLEGRARERERQSWMLGKFTFSLPGPGKASRWLWMLTFKNIYFIILSVLVLVPVPGLLWTSLKVAAHGGCPAPIAPKFNWIARSRCEKKSLKFKLALERKYNDSRGKDDLTDNPIILIKNLKSRSLPLLQSPSKVNFSLVFGIMDGLRMSAAISDRMQLATGNYSSGVKRTGYTSLLVCREDQQTLRSSS